MKICRYIYIYLIKPLLFRLHPDHAHALTMRFLAIAGAVPGVPQLIRALLTRRRPELEVSWQGLHFSSPVGLSAGLDKNGVAVPIMQAVGFGFTEVGSVTARRCDGNPKPWFYRLPRTKSLVVHAGLANEGSAPVIARLERLPRALRLAYPKVLSVARTNDEQASGDDEGIDDFLISFKRAHAAAAVQIIELNISCPNATVGERFTDPILLQKLLQRLQKTHPTKPVFMKMPITISWAQAKAIIDVAAQHSYIKGLVFGNLAKDREKIQLQDPLPSTVQGGLSGAPTRAKSTEFVHKTYKTYGDRFTIVGVGGILTPEDAYEKITAGATFVELITGLIMNGPQFASEVNQGLVELLKRDGFTHISEAVGSAHKKAR